MAVDTPYLSIHREAPASSTFAQPLNSALALRPRAPMSHYQNSYHQPSGGSLSSFHPADAPPLAQLAQRPFGAPSFATPNPEPPRPGPAAPAGALSSWYKKRCGEPCSGPEMQRHQQEKARHPEPDTDDIEWLNLVWD